jgi:hypothetical protein
MRTVLIILLFTFVFVLPARAQDSTRLARYEYVVGGILVFSLADYIGFNLANNPNGIPFWYRCIEATEQTAISYFLYKTCGLSSVIAFNLIWWTWGEDLAYYGWTNLFNPSSDALNKSDWENRTNSGLRTTGIDWAGWTPIGLTRPQGSKIARSTLIAQAVIGFSVSMAILW